MTRYYGKAKILFTYTGKPFVKIDNYITNAGNNAEARKYITRQAKTQYPNMKVMSLSVKEHTWNGRRYMK